MPLIILLIDWAQVEERISELEDIVLKSLQTQKQREQRLGEEKHGTQYAETMGQLQ